MKALSLLSGGLDSILATKLLQLQGIEMKGVCFISSFLMKRRQPEDEELEALRIGGGP